MIRRSRILVATMLLGLFVAACAGEPGGDSGTTASSVPVSVDDVGATTTAAPSEVTTTAPAAAGGDLPDPCALLTAADVMTATGVPVRRGGL